MPETKAESSKRYREKNPEKGKEYYYKNKEILNQKAMSWQKQNKDKVAVNKKKYNDSHKEKNALDNKEWIKKNPDKCKINDWKRRGVLDDDFDLLYEVYEAETLCWICKKTFSNDGMNFKALDHDHDDGSVRYICCNYCNIHIIR